MIGSSSSLRDANLARMQDGTLDVLIVGGGINGAVTASILAAGGAQVALLERSDFAGQTSQESSNLVWGGIKYLENWEFGLVWKLCGARNQLMRSYPLNVRELRFFLPLEPGRKGFKRTVPALLAGTWLYWLMGRCFTRRPRLLTCGDIAREEPDLEPDLVKGGVEYSDAYLLDNDARFVLSFVKNALNHGAALANYVEVTDARRDAQGIWIVQAQDRVSEALVTVRARVLINAAGPWVDSLNASMGLTTGPRHVLSKGVHLIVKRLTDRRHVLTFFDEQGRMFFVIPMGHRSLIGTTDTRVEHPKTQVTDADRDLVLHNINRRLRRAVPLSRDDIIAERCGVRPLVLTEPGSGDQEEWLSLSRKHVVHVSRPECCISIFGGKLTDCLNVGREVSQRVQELGVPLRDPGQAWFGEPPRKLHRKFQQEAARLRLDEIAQQPGTESLSQRLWRRYGTEAFDLLAAIDRDPELAQPISPGSEYRTGEIELAARTEMVVTLEDFLRRRSKLALLFRRQVLADSPGVRRGCRILFGDEAEERLAEYFTQHEQPS